MGKAPNLKDRTCGWLLHPTSLPGKFGCGDIGPEAHRFIDLLAETGVSWWQMLPLNPPDPHPGNSPYNSSTAFASSWLNISPELLAEDGLLTAKDLKSAGTLSGAPVDYPKARAARQKLLRKAFEAFVSGGGKRIRGFETFSNSNKNWLGDFCTFQAAKDACGQKAWWHWPAGLACRKEKDLWHFTHDHSEAIAFHAFCQFAFENQWQKLKAHASKRGVGLIGDLPIFVSHDSSDVWAHRELFKLDKQGMPTVVSGYPADDFAPKGQRWGHPHYQWQAHAKTNYAWWTSRFERMLTLFDAVRIDHFLGFYQTWAVPASAPDAVKGTWTLTPGDEIFAAVKKAIKNPQIIAEDLGRDTPGATKLRDKYGFPGMRILHFGFGGGDYHLPYRFINNCVVYTGTHDNETTVGWYKRISRTAKHELENATAMGVRASDPAGDMIRLAMGSVANLAIFPVQDVLKLGADQRMNVPGTTKNNWRWRLSKPVPADVAKAFGKLISATGRKRPAQ